MFSFPKSSFSFMDTSLFTAQNIKIYKIKNLIPIDEFHLFYSSIKSPGSKFIFNLIQSNANKCTPFSHVIFTINMERIGLVEKKISSTSFWIKPITVFDVLYRFTDYSECFKNYDAKDKIIKLPGLPPLSPIDFPSFVFDLRVPIGQLSL
ncbi:hypothetical protein H5410_064506 [Solanum commersonii]|uniref:Uncharacterized protein n=1 Tax=Solanum commersonii TaxID=4109 RepID=A0A9J5VZ89_SOLCO|nr:hypothetical protein H5410_064506 [Solanum commersonii]